MSTLLRLGTKVRQTIDLVQRTQIGKYRTFSDKALDVNTNVIKDVILYKSDGDRFFKVLNFFGVSQFVFWTYLSMTAYQTLKDIPVNEATANVWWRRINFGDSKWKNSLTIISFVIGRVKNVYIVHAVKLNL